MAKVPISGKIDLRRQAAIVTGGARGIGRACALALAREGANVAVADVIPAEEAVAAIRSHGGEAFWQETDVTATADVGWLVRAVTDRWGRIDILVNNAGTVQRVGLEDLTEELWDRDIGTILRGTYLCTRAVYPIMKEQGYGKIVTVSSIAGIAGGPVSRAVAPGIEQRGRSGPAYAAAKGGVIAFMKWVAKDGARYGIYANCVAPGPIRTEMTRGFEYDLGSAPLQRMGEPEDVAEAVLFLASQASNWVTGTVLTVDGGMLMD